MEQDFFCADPSGAWILIRFEPVETPAQFGGIDFATTRWLAVLHSHRTPRANQSTFSMYIEFKGFGLCPATLTLLS